MVLLGKESRGWRDRLVMILLRRHLEVRLDFQTILRKSCRIWLRRCRRRSLGGGGGGVMFQMLRLSCSRRLRSLGGRGLVLLMGVRKLSRLGLWRRVSIVWE